MLMFVAVAMGGLGAYLTFRNMSDSAETKVTEITKVITESKCLESYPGVCKRACVKEISQMGINWGSFLPKDDQTCVPKSDECCCQINQMDIQVVTRCSSKSSCVSIDQGVQSIKCLSPETYPLVNGNRSDVCGLPTEEFCGMEQALGSRIYLTQSFLKWVGGAIVCCAVPIFLSGLIKFSESCMGCDLSCMANSIGCIAMCFTIMSMMATAFLLAILLRGSQSLNDLCVAKPWKETSIDCVSNCQTAVDTIMTKTVCPMIDEIDTIHTLSYLLGAGSFFACILLCAMMCSKSEKRYQKFVAIPNSGPPHMLHNQLPLPSQATAYIPPVVTEYQQVSNHN